MFLKLQNLLLKFHFDNDSITVSNESSYRTNAGGMSVKMLILLFIFFFYKGRIVIELNNYAQVIASMFIELLCKELIGLLRSCIISEKLCSNCLLPSLFLYSLLFSIYRCLLFKCSLFQHIIY